MSLQGVKDAICPDCKQPVSTHALYPWKRCPVVRLSFRWLETPGGVAEALNRYDRIYRDDAQPPG